MRLPSWPGARRGCVRAGACLLLGSGSAAAQPAAADESCDPGRGPVQVEREVAPFMEAGAVPVCALAADLDGDGSRDWLLVLERVSPVPTGWTDERKRTLLLVVRDRAGGLRLAARSDRAVLSSNFGGLMDPFADVSAGRGTFTLQHYGGSAWRWEWDFTFRYVPARGTWELAEVLERRFNVIFGPGTTTESTTRAPRDFRGVSIAGECA